MIPARRLAWVALVGLVAAGCSTNPPPTTILKPAYPDFPPLTVPAGLRASNGMLTLHDEAWRRLQSGDVSGARREYADLLNRSPGFFPAQAGLGFVALASHDLKAASPIFAGLAAAHPAYLPALEGQAQTALAAGDDETAESALEAIVKLDPSRTTARDRLEVVRFRVVEALIESARRSREAGRYDEATATLAHALALSPSSSVIQRELALVDLARSRFPSAESHARKALQADSGDAEAWAVLGDVLDREANYRDAADAYAHALAIDARPAWRERRDALSAKADEAVQPPEFKAIATATSITRADVAAMIGLKLGDVIARSGRHAAVVATDVRGNWAAAWILPVIQAGVMDVFPNHTFQPAGVVRRGDLARVVSAVLTIIGGERSTDLARWTADRPAFVDVPTTHLSYPAVAVAVASGTMSASGGRFGLTRAATGADLTAAVARLRQIATR